MENPIRYLIILLQCLNVQAQLCGGGYNMLNSENLCYKIHRTPKTWNEAQLRCEQEMANLFSLTHVQNTNNSYWEILNELELRKSTGLSDIWILKLSKYLDWNYLTPTVIFSTGPCVKKNLKNNTIIVDNCDKHYPFICVRSKVTLASIIDNNVVCQPGWFSHQVIPNRCFLKGKENLTGDDILSWCREMKSDVISQESLFQLTNLGIIHPDQECSKTNFSNPCKETSICETITTPNVQVKLLQNGHPTIWIQSTENPVLTCNLMIQDKLISPSETTSVQFEWIRNGFIVPEWKTQMVTVDPNTPLKQLGTMDKRLGTYQCRVRIPSFPGTFNSNKFAILFKGHQPFSLSLKLIAGESDLKDMLSYWEKKTTFWNERQLSELNSTFYSAFENFSNASCIQWLVFALEIDWQKIDFNGTITNVEFFNLTVILSLSTDKDEKTLTLYLVKKFINQTLLGDYLVQDVTLDRNDLCPNEGHPKLKSVFTWKPQEQQSVHTFKPPCLSKSGTMILQRKCFTDFIKGYRWEEFDHNLCLKPLSRHKRQAIWGPPVGAFIETSTVEPTTSTSTIEPSTSTTKPSTSTTEPSTSTRKPSTSTRKPSTSTTKPSTSTTKPSTSTTEPSTSTTKPSTSTTKPSTSTTKPSTSTTKPSTSTTKPSTSAKKPSTSTRKPSTSTRKPSTSTTEPSASTTKPSTSTTEPSLRQLAKSDITNETAEQVGSQLWGIIQNTSNFVSADVSDVATILQMLSNENMSHQTVAENVGHVIDNLMRADEDAIRKANQMNSSANRITESFEKIIGNTDVELKLPTVYAKSFRPSLDTIVGLAAMQNKNTSSESYNFDGNDVTTFTEQNKDDFATENADVAIFFQSTLFLDQSDRISFIIYENATLFPTDSRNVTVNSRVMSATVTSRNSTFGHVKPQTQLVKLIFQPLKPYRKSSSIYCVYWDISSDSGRGDWSTRGCRLDRVHKGKVICYCDHLTNFAVLMDISNQTTQIGEEHIANLSILTNVGCAISILGLSLTIVTFLLFKKWRAKLGNKVLCNLSVALLLVLVTFLIGIDQVHRPKACVVVTALLHFSLLATFCWMLVEAILQYLLLVKVFNTYIPRFMRKAMLFAWGTPIIIVATCMSVKLDHYSGNHSYCWLQGDALHFAFLLPVGVIIFINVIVFVRVIKGITWDRKTMIRNNQPRYENVKRNVIAGLCMFVLLGITWVFGFLIIIADTSIIIQYIFCICNSLQGTIIFIFMVLRDKNAQDLWSSICKPSHQKHHSQSNKSAFSTSVSGNQHRVLLHDETNF